MNVWRLQWWAAVLLVFLAGEMLAGCSSRKQVPFGLEDAGAPSTIPISDTVEGVP